MLSRMLPSVRKAASGRMLAAGRVPVAQLQASSFHAGTVLREEEKESEAPAKGNFFLESLGDWNRAVPIGVAMAIPAVQLDVYMITEETQLFCCFMLFVGSAYSLAGDAVGAFMDEKGEAILKEHNAVENAQIATVESTLEAHQLMMTCQSEIRDIFAAQKDLFAQIVARKDLQHAVRNGIVAKLDVIVQEEAALAASVQSTLVEAATANVTDAFTNGDASMKSDALAAAMDALAGKTGGSDAVADMYGAFINKFGSDLAAMKGTEQPLSAEQVKTLTAELNTIMTRDGLGAYDHGDGDSGDGLTLETPTSVTMTL